MLGASADIEIAAAATGRARAFGAARESRRLAWCWISNCPTCPASKWLEKIRDDAELCDVPVVVFTAVNCRRTRTPDCATMARSVLVKGVESPERLLDETSLFPAPRGRGSAARQSKPCCSACTAPTRTC